MPNFKKYHIIDTHSPESSLFYEIFSNKSQKKHENIHTIPYGNKQDF